MQLFGFKSFDELLAFHCAPVFAGIKPSNMISLLPDDVEEINKLLAEYNKQFASKGLVFRRLCSGTKRILILVYNPIKLFSLLKEPGYQAYLIAVGYEANASLENYLCCLGNKLDAQGNFPHEIGIFLGYPLEDVLGFVLNKGEYCKYSGYWKVYGDVPKARKLFSAYEHCRNFILRRLDEGLTLQAAITVQSCSII